jgi:hypothetical protein
MREHHVYRLWVSLLYGDQTAAADALAAAAEPPRADDPIAAMLQSKPPVDFFGRYWSELIARGFRALPRLDAEQYLAVRFEDLVAKPAEVLATIADFFAFDAADDGWIERAAALVRGIPPARFGGLAVDEQALLDASCRPGRQLLGQTE